MSNEAPKTIWAWSWNFPMGKAHGTRTWVDFPPVIKPVDVYVEEGPWWKFWKGHFEPVEQVVTEYVRRDIAEAAVSSVSDALDTLVNLATEYRAGVLAFDGQEGGLDQKIERVNAAAIALDTAIDAIKSGRKP